MKLSVVLPAHNEADCLGSLIPRLTQVLEGCGREWQIVFVDDGSADGTWPLMKEAADRDPRIRALRLSRNFGHQMALTAGLEIADGDGVITMDSDLQHPPEIIPALLERAAEGFDVVYAVRGEHDAEGRYKVGSARLFYWLLNRLASLDLPHGGADFRYMSRRAVEALLAMPERHRFLRGMTRWVGYPQSIVEYERQMRVGGRTKYTPRHMIRFAFDAVVSFSALPLRMASLFGLLFSALGSLYLAYVLAARVFTDDVVSGWTSVIGVALVLGGVQLACLGIIGQYIGRMYDELKGRPLFVVWEDTGDERAQDSRPALSGRTVRT